MNKPLLSVILALIAIASLGSYYMGTISTTGQVIKESESSAENIVTIDNFVRAETDNYFRINQVVNDAFGKFDHFRDVVPIDEQDVIRMNRDALYSSAIFDLTTPVTITKPDTGDRFQSMIVINQDHYVKMVEHDPGKYTLTQDNMGTRYVIVIFRTLVDAEDPEDIIRTNNIQDQIIAEQESMGTLDLPDWDQESLNEVRDFLNDVALNLEGTTGAFGDEDEVDPLIHLLGAAYIWGGSPPSAATFLNQVVDNNDGNTPYTITIDEEVPVDGFWSVSIYNEEGFFEKNEYDAYVVNNINAVTNEDGKIIIHFGGDPSSLNFLPIEEGWNYIIRLYQPRQEILDGSWTFPDAIKVT